MNVIQIAQKAKTSTPTLLALSESVRINALESIARNLKLKSDHILNQNALDLADASHLSSAMIERLTLTEKSIETMSQMCQSVAHQPQITGIVDDEYERPNGLKVQKQRIPLGVIGMVFESRPNVVIDGSALAIKSGNAIILKGGKEAQHSNRALFEVIKTSIQGLLPEGSVSLLESREDVAALLKLHQYIDLMVPRGGSALVDFVRKNATMPVVAHDKGLCHLYVHSDAKVSQVIPVILNGKIQRPGVCNALETLLLHEQYPNNKEVLENLKSNGVEIRGCPKTQKILEVKSATEEDYHTEWLAKIISVKIVQDLDEAIKHIQIHSSHHTEAILAQDPQAIEKFLNSLDASCLVVNASTRFNDGSELGLGAELGISTTKLHAYGPMGAKEMTTTRFVVLGSGQTR